MTYYCTCAVGAAVLCLIMCTIYLINCSMSHALCNATNITHSYFTVIHTYSLTICLGEEHYTKKHHVHIFVTDQSFCEIKKILC